VHAASQAQFPARDATLSTQCSGAAKSNPKPETRRVVNVPSHIDEISTSPHVKPSTPFSLAARIAPTVRNQLCTWDKAVSAPGGWEENLFLSGL
jgi:hypothetical protein